MKTIKDINKHKFFTLSVRFNKEEQNIINQLKEKHGINISGIIKILLKQKLEQLEQLE